MLAGMLPALVLAKTVDTLSLDISQGSITIENGTDANTFKLTCGSNTVDNIDPTTFFVISGTTSKYSITVSANLIKDGISLPAATPTSAVLKYIGNKKERAETLSQPDDN